jgi:PAS domain S-box-containing protein
MSQPPGNEQHDSLQGDEARLRWTSKVFMDAADPILIEDLEGQVIDMNLQAERSYGWRRDELLGQSIRTIVPEDRHEQAIELLDRCNRGEEVRNVEGLRRDKQGKVIPVLVTLSLLRGETGQPIGIASLAKDISEQKAGEEKLRTLSKVFMESADPILIEDLDGKVIEMNQEAERSYGWERDRLIGMPIIVIVPAECHDQARELLRRCKAGDDVRNVEGMRQTLGGEVRSVLLTLSLLRDDEGNPTGVASIAKDITAQKADEEQMRSMSKVFMEAADPILIEDLNGNVTEMNQEAERAYGWSRSELIGKPIRTLVPDDRHTQALEILARCRAGLEVRNVEGLRRTKQGGIVPVLLTLSLLRDDDDRPIGIASLAKDITEQKIAESKLRTMSKVFMEAADPILIEDRDGLVLDMNQEAERAYGWNRSELIGKPIRTLVPEERHSQANDLLTRCKQGDTVRNVEGLRQTKWGGVVPVLLTLSILRDDEEQLIGIASLAKDITDQKAVEQALADAKHAADEANQAKSSFLANMSHELRTPMNAIIGYSEMLIEEATDDGHDSYIGDLQKIHGAGRHLLALINDVLDLAKIESGKMDLYLEPIDLDTLIDDVASTVDALIQKKHNELVVERVGELGTVTADLTKVRQMLFNLISNAAKFTENGKITLAVSRIDGDDEDLVEYAVSDDGIGIPADKIDSLFDEFSQVEATTARDYGGTGLGLPITKRFCEMMGGSIEVTSVPGQGSTFAIRLPAVIVDDTVSDAERPAAQQPEALPEGRCVLVIDDEPNARDLIRRALEREGHPVAVASSGEEGLALARQLEPRLITLDAVMPGKDGWAVLRELKEDPRLRNIPVIMISMLDGSDMGFALGATDYLTKPVEREHLLDVLKRHGVAPATGRVLVVDDEAETRERFRRILEKEKCDVLEATNGREALEVIDGEPPDLILLDLMMPVMDGFAFMHELRKVEAWREIPVIVATAKDLTAEERAELSGTVESIVQKNPCSMDDLMAQARATLATHTT